MKVELKRKQTTIDLVRSERDRIQRYKDELEGKIISHIFTLHFPFGIVLYEYYLNFAFCYNGLQN